MCTHWNIPILGCKYEFQEDDVSAGASVMVQIDPDVFKIAQEEHGGWNDDMAEVRMYAHKAFLPQLHDVSCSS